MEIILKENVKGLGYKNDTITVKAGYGRNFLIPQGKAIVANTQNKKIVAENIKQAAHKAEKMMADAKEFASKIENVVLTIPTKVGDNGKLFGTITALQIADLLKEKGVDVDRKDISIDMKDKIKEVGNYTASVDLHKGIKAVLNFEVVAE